MPEVADILESQKDHPKRQSQPLWVAPMLATLTDEYFSHSDWIFERKLDGERVMAYRKGKQLKLLSRNKKRLDDTYPELAEALLSQRVRDFVVDEEVVAFEGARTSFARLQKRMQLVDAEKIRHSGVAVFYYLFDALHVDGRNVMGLPLRTRKQILSEMFSFADPLRLSVHRNASGEEFLREACGKGWEGLIAKRADSAYQSRRSRDWLKFKCGGRQELVVGGFTDPQKSRLGFGALLVGYYKDGKLRCAGKVGTGYDDATLKSLRKRLGRIERESSPFDSEDVRVHGVHWVSPKLVAEVGFTEWTTDGKLRHPRFLGLRRDKDAHDVHKEGAA